jgi:aryl-alcohol dehydrogenase-like predicted oxidoreductase
MQYRQLGKSDIKASVIVYGAWAIGGSMWGGSDENAAIDAIRASIDMGVTTIDTAPLYGMGLSESLVAKAVAGKRDKVQIFDKYGLRADREEGEYFFVMEGKYKVYKNARPQSIFEECERSLKLLNTDHIDLYQCHWRDHTTPVEDTMSAMEKLYKQGKIRAAGVSNFSVDEIEQANRVFPVASAQPPYSMINRDIEKDLLPYCLKHDIGVLVYSPLQRGLLTGKFKPDHKFAPGDHRVNQPHYKPENIRRVNAFLESIRPIAERHDASVSQLVIFWTINQPGITSALVGARDAEQARDNSAAADLKVSPDELREVTAMLDELKLDL